MSINNDNLLKRLANGDEQALKLVVERYHGKLLQIASQILHSRELAEETVMDVFMGFWERRDRLVAVTHLSWYLYSTVKNRSLNILRKQKSKPAIYLDEITVDISFSVSPEDLMVSSEYIDRINQAINTLPPRFKQIFVMVKEEQLRYRQVAELLQVSVKTVENQMGIALKKMHDALDA